MTAEKPKTAQLQSVMQTDVGMVRDHNEDAAYADDAGRFFIVADGMGGHAAGEVASAMAVETVREELLKEADLIEAFAAEPSDVARKRLIEALEKAVRNAHQAVYDRGIKESDKQGMGTTLDVLLLAGGDAFVAHVGDSRTYLVRDGKAAQITTDHTVAEVLVIEGKLSVEEAASSPLRTILVNAIGVAADVGVEMAHLKLRDGDYFLLCSDGLHDYFPTEQEIADKTLDKAGITSALDDFIEMAKERGGHDNITGVLVHIESAPDIPDVDVDDDDDDDDNNNVDGLEDTEAIPKAIARDDTMPVDVDKLLAEQDEAVRRRKELELATTGNQPAIKDTSDDDEPVDGEAATVEIQTGTGDQKPMDQVKKAHDAKSDLKTTVPIRPLREADKKPPSKD